ncbi:Uncharacterised protein [Mycobacteroides abscessus subsp. abscessus]|nr:Uncharacterised protein [Mycobacteroides abscessus subsp. abscessus]
MRSDLHKRDRYLFVTNRDVGKWPRKGSLGGGGKSFRAARRKTTVASVLEGYRPHTGCGLDEKEFCDE